MTMPTQGDVHVNTPLSNISVAYIQDSRDFVADVVFPNIPVAKQSDRYYTYDRGHFNRNVMDLRAAGAESAGVGYEVDGTPSYFCDVYALHKDIPDQVRANADSVIGPDRDATALISQLAMIKREKVWAAAYFAGSKWTNDWDGTATGAGATEVMQWSDLNSDPIADIRLAKRTVKASTGLTPNTLILGYEVRDFLLDHPDIVDRLKYGQTAGRGIVNADESDLAALFKIDRVLTMGAIENTAKEGQTNVHAFIGGKKALLVHSAPRPGLLTPTAGYTFSWNGLFGSSAMGGRIKKFRMENKAADRVEIEMAFAHKLVAADLGFFFDTIVAA